jgi:protein ImuA
MPPVPLPGRCRTEIVEKLRRLLPRLERVSAGTPVLSFELPILDAHLPQGGLVRGALHEIAPQVSADTAAAFGFLAALLTLPALSSERPVLFVGGTADHGRVYGHGVHGFGLDPARLILVETKTDKQSLWAMEEAVRSRVPAAVAAPIDKLDLKTSQRLHLAAGEAGLPLLLLRPAKATQASAAATRWRVGSAEAARDRFGLIARWRWNVSLERCRNGRPGEWLVEFDHGAHRFSLAAPLADSALSGGDAPLVKRAG